MSDYNFETYPIDNDHALYLNPNERKLLASSKDQEDFLRRLTWARNKQDRSDLMATARKAEHIDEMVQDVAATVTSGEYHPVDAQKILNEIHRRLSIGRASRSFEEHDHSVDLETNMFISIISKDIEDIITKRLKSDSD